MLRSLLPQQVEPDIAHELQMEKRPDAKRAIRARAHRRLALTPQSRAVHNLVVTDAMGVPAPSTAASAAMLADQWGASGLRGG